MTVNITPIAEHHIGGFHQAVDIVSRERKYLAFLEGPPLEMSREFVLNNIANAYPQMVAVSEGKVVGWCDIIPNSRAVHVHSGRLGMGVLPEFRGRGIGSSLIAKTIEAAHQFRLIRIELTVYAKNLTAIALYERFGFLHEGVMKDACLIDGQYQDVYLMALVDHMKGGLLP